MGTNMIIGGCVGSTSLSSNVNQNEPEVDAYITGLTTPLSAAQIGRLNTLVASLKSGLGVSALSDAFDVMYVLAGETAESSLRNLVKNAHYATAVNSPTFTQYEGFTGDGVSSYLNSSYIPATHKNVLSLNSASVGVYSRTNFAKSGSEIGSYSSTASGTDNIGMSIWLTNNISYARLFIDTYATYVPTSALGLHIANKKASGELEVYSNKQNKVTATGAANIAINNHAVYILARNEIGVAGKFSTRQLSIAFIAKGLTQSDVNVITDAIEAYMDANGKGVIA